MPQQPTNDNPIIQSESGTDPVSSLGKLVLPKAPPPEVVKAAGEVDKNAANIDPGLAQASGQADYVGQTAAPSTSLSTPLGSFASQPNYVGDPIGQPTGTPPQPLDPAVQKAEDERLRSPEYQKLQQALQLSQLLNAPPETNPEVSPNQGVQALPPPLFQNSQDSQIQKQYDAARQRLTTGDPTQGFIDSATKDLNSSVIKGSSNNALYDGQTYQSQVDRANKSLAQIQSWGSTEVQRQKAASDLSTQQASNPSLRPTTVPPANQFRPNSQANPTDEGSPLGNALASDWHIITTAGTNAVNAVTHLFGGVEDKVRDSLGLPKKNDSQEFAPLQGVHQFIDAVKKNPALIITTPVALPLVAATQGKFGQSGNGLAGATMYVVGGVVNLAGASATTEYQTLFQGKNPIQAAKNNITQVAKGGIYSFTQPPSPDRPLGIGNTEPVPRSLSDLKKRNILWGNPITSTAIDVYKNFTGNDRINKDTRRIIKGVEIIAGLGGDALAGGGLEEGAATIAEHVNPATWAKKVPHPIEPEAITPKQPVQITLPSREIVGANLPAREMTESEIATAKLNEPEAQVNQQHQAGVSSPTKLQPEEGSSSVPKAEASAPEEGSSSKPPIIPPDFTRTVNLPGLGESQVQAHFETPSATAPGTSLSTSPQTPVTESSGTVSSGTVSAQPTQTTPVTETSGAETTQPNLPSPPNAPTVGGLAPSRNGEEVDKNEIATVAPSSQTLPTIPGDTQEAARRQAYEAHRPQPYTRVLADGSEQHSPVPFNSPEYRQAHPDTWKKDEAEATNYSSYGKADLSRKAAIGRELYQKLQSGTVDPSQTPLAVVQRLSTPKPGDTVDPNAIAQVYRSPSERTALAMRNGDAQPGRGLKPLPESRIQTLRTESPTADATYDPFGKPVDEAAVRSQLPKHPAVGDVPVPKDPAQLQAEIDHAARIASDPTQPPEIRTQAAHTGDIHSDALVSSTGQGLPSPEQAEAYRRNLPSDLQVSSEEGRAQLGRYLQHHEAYADSARVAEEQNLKLTSMQNELLYNLRENIDHTPDVGREFLPTSPRSLPVEWQFPALKSEPDLVSNINRQDYYHGTKVVNHDLAATDPHIGGSRNELGTGHYLTSSIDEAEHSAKASVNNNVPPIGQQFDPHPQGEVHQVRVNVDNVLDANKPVPDNVKFAIQRAARDAGFDQAELRVVNQSLSKPATLADIYSQVEVGISSSAHTAQEEKLLTFQRQVSKRLRDQGYDAIAHTDAKSSLLNIINPEKITSQKRVGIVGDGTVLEQAANHYNVASRTWERFNNQATEIRAREAGATLQSRIAQQTHDNYVTSANHATARAYRLVEEERKLRNIARAERVTRDAEREREWEAKNETQAKHQNRPDNTWCG